MAENEIKSINGRKLQDEKARQDIANISVPTKTSELTNDSNFITSSEVDTKIANAQISGGNADLSLLIEVIPDNNLFDKDNLVTSYIDDGGSTVNGTFTNYIKLEQGQKYITNLNHTQFIFFDKDKSFVKKQTYIDNPQVIDGNGGYLLIKLDSDYSKALVLEGTDIDAYKPQHISFKNNKWLGKKWLCIGDSITTDSGIYATNGYGKLISRELGMTLTNIAVSGKVMYEAYTWLDNCSEKFDLITVMLGTNNQGYNCGIGSLNDSYYQSGTYNSNNSFYAQVQLLVEKLKNKYPKSVILFLTPIKRTSTDGNNDSNGYQINALSKTTKEYRDVIIDVCNYYSIPYIDLYNAIDPRTEENRKLYFVKEDGSDGTHPNDLGHALFIAPVVKDAIVKQEPYYFNEWSTIPDVPVVTKYTITNNLTNCANSNSINKVDENSSYTATLTANGGYEIDTITVTMGENDITSTAVSGNTITISSVTGNIVITAIASQTTTTTKYTITNNLTNCTNNNSATELNENDSYTATLLANSGYKIDSINVTMGGSDITSTVVSGNVITISSVTGDIVITVTTSQTSTPSDNTFSMTSGYEVDKISGNNVTKNGGYVSDFIAVNPDTNYEIKTINPWVAVYEYDQNKTYICKNSQVGIGSTYILTVTTSSTTNYIKVTCNGSNDSSTGNTIKQV